MHIHIQTHIHAHTQTRNGLEFDTQPYYAGVQVQGQRGAQEKEKKKNAQEKEQQWVAPTTVWELWPTNAQRPSKNKKSKNIDAGGSGETKSKSKPNNPDVERAKGIAESTYREVSSNPACLTSEQSTNTAEVVSGAPQARIHNTQQTVGGGRGGMSASVPRGGMSASVPRGGMSASVPRGGMSASIPRLPPHAPREEGYQHLGGGNGNIHASTTGAHAPLGHTTQQLVGQGGHMAGDRQIPHAYTDEQLHVHQSDPLPSPMGGVTARDGVNTDEDAMILQTPTAAAQELGFSTSSDQPMFLQENSSLWAAFLHDEPMPDENDTSSGQN